MENEPILKEKAIQLLRAERELFALRLRYVQTASWLRVTQSLPQIIEHKLSMAELYTRISRVLLTALRLQRTSFFTYCSGELVLISDKGNSAPRMLSIEAQKVLGAERAGLCNEPNNPGLAELSTAIGLHRFVWTTMRFADTERVLLAAGFDKARAAFQDVFDDAHAEEFATLGHHIETLLRNAMLVSELELDKERLKQFNDTLEHRVVQRTQELARAVATLEEKDARLAEDLRQACQFQQGILPILKIYPGIQFEAVYRPVDVVGGDIYDVSEIGKRRFRVLVADVTGHGVQASLRTIVLKGEYDRLKANYEQPDQLLATLNQSLASVYRQSEMLSTACCFDIDFDGCRPMLRVSCAGHPPPIRVRRSGVVEEIDCMGPFLAAKENAAYRLVEQPLELGDIVLGYSDGLTEQRTENLRDTFDLVRILSALAPSHDSLANFLKRILEQWERFRASTPVDDDLTMLAARIE